MQDGGSGGVGGTSLPSLLNTPQGGGVTATGHGGSHQLSYVKREEQLLPPTPSASSSTIRSVGGGKRKRMAQLPGFASTPMSSSSRSTRRSQQLHDQKKGAALSAQILARAHEDMHRGSEVKWGCGRLGSITDKPLVGAHNSSHKPPLLTAMENTVSRSLASLNAKPQHRQAGYLLGTAIPLHITTAPPEVQQYPLALQAPPEELDQEPAAGAQSINMIYNSIQHTDEARPFMLPPACKRRGTTESEASFAGTDGGNRSVADSVAPSCLGEIMGGADSADDEARRLAYRVERLLIFQKLSKQFAAAFHTYRPMLTWIMEEHFNLLELLIENVKTTKASNLDRTEQIQQLQTSLSTHERESEVNLRMKERELAMAQRKVDTAQKELKAAEAKCRALRRQIDAMEETLGDTEETKRRLQRHVLQLEKRLDEKGLLSLEEEFQKQKEQALSGLIDEIDKLNNHNQISQRENYHLKLQIRELEERKRGLKSEAELEHLTPRPDWRSSPIVDQFRYVGCTANSVQVAAEMMYEMEQELLELRCSEKLYKRKWFLGLGMGENVLPFMRFEGKVKNMQLRKSALETHIADFWKYRESQRKRVNVVDCFCAFLSDRYGEAKLIEWSYNIYYSLHRYQDDPDCMIFLNILIGEIDESVWHDELELLDKLRDAMIMLDHGQNGALPIDTLMTAVRKIFPAKPDDNMELLAKSLEAHQNAEKEVVYITLFEDDEDSHQSEFIEMLRRQNIDEREMYLWELAEAVANVDDGNGVITGADFMQAIKNVDGDIPPAVLARLLQHVFTSIGARNEEDTSSEEEDDAPVMARSRRGTTAGVEPMLVEEPEEREGRVEEVVRALKSCRLKRYTKPAAFSIRARKTRVTSPQDPELMLQAAQQQQQQQPDPPATEAPASPSGGNSKKLGARPPRLGELEQSQRLSASNLVGGGSSMRTPRKGHANGPSFEQSTRKGAHEREKGAPKSPRIAQKKGSGFDDKK